MHKFTKPQGMSVPENYFETNKQGLMAIPKKQKKGKLITLFTYIGSAAAVAATVLLVYLSIHKQNPSAPNFNDLSASLMVEYLMDEGTEPAYAPLQYTSFWEETELDLSITSPVSEEQLEDYLMLQDNLNFENI